MQTQEPEQIQVVDILFAVVVFLQTDYRPFFCLMRGGSAIPTQPIGCCSILLTKNVAFVTITQTQSEFGF